MSRPRVFTDYLNFPVTPETRQKIEKIARENNMTLAECGRATIDAGIAHYEMQKRAEASEKKAK